MTTTATLRNADDAKIKQFYNSRISHCLFLLRDDHYERPRVDWMLQEIRGGVVLEVGCGNGGMTRLLAPQVEKIVALDICEGALDVLNRENLPNVETVYGFVEHYDPEETFDWIVLADVLEHLREPEASLQKCAGWLKPGGQALISVPNGSWPSPEHLHAFGIQGFKWALEKAKLGVDVFLIKDRDDKDRWLGGRLRK